MRKKTNKNINIYINISLTKNKCCPQRKKKRIPWASPKIEVWRSHRAAAPGAIRGKPSPEMGLARNGLDGTMEPWPNFLLNLQRTYHIYSGKLGNSQLGTPSSEDNWELMIEDPFGTIELSCFAYMHILRIYIYVYIYIYYSLARTTHHFIWVGHQYPAAVIRGATKKLFDRTSWSEKMWRTLHPTFRPTN